MNRRGYWLIVAAWFGCISGAVAADDAQNFSTMLAELNRVRAQPSCMSAPAAGPLKTSNALDRAAAELAGLTGTTGRTLSGAPLNEVLRAAGYRATRSMLLQTGGMPPGVALARFVEQRYCRQITSADWQEIGFHQRVSGSQVQVWVVMARPFVAPADARAPELATRVLELVNRARGTPRSCGGSPYAAAPPVRGNAVLDRAAKLHADDMASRSFFSHDGSDGSKPADRATRAGYVWRAVGENIAGGQATPEDAVQGWIDSPPHCTNLMNPQFTEMGVAFGVNLHSTLGIYWAQLFATPSGTPPAALSPGKPSPPGAAR